jgi:transposase
MSGVKGSRMEGLVSEEGRLRSGDAEGRRGGGGLVGGRARRKEEVILRLLRGEGLDALARETGQAAGTISRWREEFLSAGREGLKTRSGPVEDRELAEAQRKIGELTMEADILRGLIEEMGRHPRSPRR